MSGGKLVPSAEAAPRVRRARVFLASLIAVLSASGCNSLLGIQEASLTCVGATCDGGANPLGGDPAQAPGGGGGSASANGGSGSSSLGVALDAGLDASSPLGALNGAELPGNVILPAPDVANTGGGAGASDNSGSGSDNSGSGSDNSGSGRDDDDDPNGGNEGSGSGNGGSPQPPPSLCAARAAGEAFCSGATRISCGPGGSVDRSLVCSSAQHCQQGSGPNCAACLSGDARCEGAVLSVCNAAGSGFDSQRCASASLCNAAQLRCEGAACAPNESRCRGRTLDRCNAAGTALEPAVDCGSPQRCNERAGRCDVCEPGTTRCLNATTVAACDTAGATETPIACGVLESCSAGACTVLGGGLPLP